MPAQPPAAVDDLGLQAALGLWALLTGQERRLPIAPTRRMTLANMETLAAQGVIEVPWPQAQWGIAPDAQQTPLEGLQWRLAWKAYQPARLLEALEDYLGNASRDELGLAIRLGLWIDLSAAEAERFFGQQLERHRFPQPWAEDIAFAHRYQRGGLSQAQWRYCAWAAVRRGASLALQQAQHDSTFIRESIYQELNRRASAIGSGAWTKAALPPFHPTPENALARGFLRLLAPLGMSYWVMAPSLEVLESSFAPGASNC